VGPVGFAHDIVFVLLRWGVGATVMLLWLVNGQHDDDDDDDAQGMTLWFC
jgi:hypothetical protein